jgi:hypothetical protein
MLVVIHKECGGPALEESPVGEVCAIPVDRFPFPASPAWKKSPTRQKCAGRKN